MQKLFYLALAIALAHADVATVEEAKPTETVVEETDSPLCDSIHPEEITKSVDERSQHSFKGLKIAEIEEEYVPPAASEPRVSYEGSQLLRVVVDTKEKKRIVSKLRDMHEISMWGGNQSAIDILVRAATKEGVLASLATATINYEVVIANVQQAIDEENPSEDAELANRQGHQMTWSSYHRLADIHSYLDYLGATYPNLVSTQVIGTSHNGRPLKLVKVSNGGAGNRALWIDGGIHAREWISPAAVTYILNDLVLNYDALPAALRTLDWYFLPVANPDGYEYSHETDRLWRKNRARRAGQCAGTDLNRNFGYKWGGRGSGHNPCQEIYAGTGPFSEPESDAIRNFITHTKANWQGYVSYHSYGQYILYPWGYDRVVTTDHQEMTRVAQAAASAIRAAGGPSYTIGPAGSTLYPAAGGSDDWAKGTMKMAYAYTIELRDTGRHGFVLPAPYIKPTAAEAWAALRVIAEAVAQV